MNQIIFNYDYKKEFSNKNNFIFKKRKIIYLFFFIITTVSVLVIFCYIFYNKYTIYKKNLESNKIMNNYKISTLYSNSSNYSSIKLSNNIEIIGLIEIPKINVSYPILAQSNEELLKISVCRFSGPLPNHTGNLCIAGHNYKNTMMFSKIDELNINDTIYISDLKQNRLKYIVYNKFDTKENDFSVTSNSNNTEITLITCNKNNNKKRVIIKAKMKEI